MSRLNELKADHPILSSIALAILFLVLLRVTNKFVSLISFDGQVPYLLELIKEVTAVIFAVIFLLLIGGKKILTEKGNNFMPAISVAMFPIVVSALLIISSLANTQGTLVPATHIAIFVLFVIAIGIAEELIFRGCITNILANKYLVDEKGVYFTVFLSGAIFGLLHLANILSGVEITGAINQALGAFSGGCLLTAIYLRSRNIWIVAFVHAFEDFAGMFDAGMYGISTIEKIISSYTSIKLISVIVYLIPTLYLLRRSKMKEIISLNQEKFEGPA